MGAKKAPDPKKTRGLWSACTLAEGRDALVLRTLSSSCLLSEAGLVLVQGLGQSLNQASGCLGRHGQGLLRLQGKDWALFVPLLPGEEAVSRISPWAKLV